MKRLLWYVPAIVWAAVLLSIGGRSDVPTVETDLPLDKVAHFILYGFLGLLSAYGWLRNQRWPSPVLPLVFALSIGAVDELNQATVPGRASEPMDWVADICGASLAFAWAITRSDRRQRREVS